MPRFFAVSRYLSAAVTVAICSVFCFETVEAQEAPAAASAAAIKDDMAAVYASFKGLQKFMYSRDAFVDAANEKEIMDLIDGFRGGVHRADLSESKYKDDPGFASTLKVLNQLLDDARSRFVEGKKGYALWRLKTSANYCVACHTRHEVKVDFSDSDRELGKLNAYEQGEFYLASRQFEKARSAFISAVMDPSLSTLRMDALRKWLIIYVRVYPDPQAAIKQINRLRPRAKFTRYEEDEIIGWLGSLRRWQNEGQLRVPEMAKAENLMRQGLGMNDPLSRQKGTVELLRATSILHRLLEERGAGAAEQRSYVLYLLGLAYSELPFFFVNELPELFLKQVIREYPGSNEARNAFRVYREVVTLGYTGSGGTRVPDDVQQSIRELYDLAYGVPTVEKGKV